MEKLNTLPNTWESSTIADWLLQGLENLDDQENPWTNAFPPLVLHGDIELELQLVSHFTSAGGEATECLTQGLLLALEKWRTGKRTFVVLKGLLNMIAEIDQIARFETVFWQLLTEDLQADDADSVYGLRKLVNVLASLSPEPCALKLLQDFYQLGKPKWRPNLAALLFIAKIVDQPDQWSTYFRELRGDLKAMEHMLDPDIFFDHISNVLGTECIASQLRQLELGQSNTDAWFLEKLLGLPESPVKALRNDNNQWILIKPKNYFLGKEGLVVLPINGDYSRINNQFDSMFKGINNDRNRCHAILSNLISFYSKNTLKYSILSEVFKLLFCTFQHAIVVDEFIALLSKCKDVTTRGEMLDAISAYALNNLPETTQTRIAEFVLNRQLKLTEIRLDERGYLLIWCLQFLHKENQPTSWFGLRAMLSLFRAGNRILFPVQNGERLHFPGADEIYKSFLGSFLLIDRDRDELRVSHWYELLEKCGLISISSPVGFGERTREAMHRFLMDIQQAMVKVNQTQNDIRTETQGQYRPPWTPTLKSTLSCIVVVKKMLGTETYIGLNSIPT